MKKIILAVVVLGMLGWAVFDFINPTNESTNQQDSDTYSENTNKNEEVIESNTVGIQKGDIAPDFELTTLTGDTVKLSDYRGTKVFINFWATWCPPCRAEMPDMQKVYEETDNLEILAVNLTASEQNEDVVGEFVESYGLTFPILMDRSSEVSTMYRVSAYPTSFMIDTEGRISFVAIGAMNHDMMVREIEAMKEVSHL